jgi:hypothetical protein
MLPDRDRMGAVLSDGKTTQFPDVDRRLRTAFGQFHDRLGGPKWLQLWLTATDSPPKPATAFSQPTVRLPQFYWLVQPSAEGSEVTLVLPPTEAKAVLADQDNDARGSMGNLTSAVQLEVTAKNNTAGVPVGKQFKVRLSARRPRVAPTRLRAFPASAAPPDSLAAKLTLADGKLCWADSTGLSPAEAAAANDYIHRLANVVPAHLREQAAQLDALMGGLGRADSATDKDKSGKSKEEVARLLAQSEAVHAEAVSVATLAHEAKVLFDAVAAAPTAPTTLKVHAEYKAAAEFDESITCSAFNTVYDPFEAAAVLRRREGIPTPNPDLEPSGPQSGDRGFAPVLWGAMQTAGGWAQIPFFNLTEELYLRLVPRPVAHTFPQPILMEGAAVFGNDAPTRWAEAPGEQRWSVTVLDADAVDGEWTFNRADGSGPWVPGNLTVTLRGPELVLNGFLWLATKPPSAADFLPDLDEWPTALRQLQLRTPAPDGLFPSPYRARFDSIKLTRPASPGSPILGRWVMDYRPYTDPLPNFPKGVFCQLRTDPSPFHNAEDFTLPALAWRKHPTLPAVQSLPLTQVQRPPSYPSANRQLVAFEFATNAGAAFTGESASEWAAAAGPLAPAREWMGTTPTLIYPGSDYLSLTFLSLIGVAAHPVGPVADPFVPVQYHFGLTYCDEINALSESPKNPMAGEPETMPPPPPRIPSRPLLASYWAELVEKGFLAAADADTALGTESVSSEELTFRGVVEPYSWPVRAHLTTDTYPGGFRFENRLPDEPAVDKRGISFGTGANDIHPLRGIDGTFSLFGHDLVFRPAGDGQFRVVAGSLEAAEVGKSRRDQRGLTTGATTASDQVLVTKVTFEENTDSIRPYELLTLRQALRLNVGQLAPPQETMNLWFRDLPIASDAPNRIFDRAKTGSPFREGVNDPEAAGRRFNFLNGYEWRLTGPPAMRLGPFDFYPLTLETVEFTGSRVASVRLTGRLQLPVPQLAEQQDQSNAVSLVFKLGDKGLTLASMGIVAPDRDVPRRNQTAPPELVWPLSAVPGGPQLRVGGLGYDAQTGLTLSAIRVELSLYGEPWAGAFAPPPPVTASTTSIHFSKTYDPGEAVAVVGLACTLRFPPPLTAVAAVLGGAAAVAVSGHELVATLRARWGDPHGVHLEALAVWDLLRPATLPQTTQAKLMPAGIGLELDFKPGKDQLPHRAFQVSWTRFTPGGIPSPQLLPGFVAAGAETPGFAVMTFRPAADGADPPKLLPETGFLEMLIPCRWGESLQGRATEFASLGQNTRAAAVFGSSAGNVDVGLTVRLVNPDAATWSTELLLNGVLEVKNLASWPVPRPSDPLPPVVTFPAVRRAGHRDALTHYRHTARVLLNQVVISGDRLLPADPNLQPALVYKFGPKETDDIQFLAVVEHQLVRVDLDSETPASIPLVLGLGGDRRWTLVQKVRLVSPASFTAFLTSFQRTNIQARWTSNLRTQPELRLLKEVALGYFCDSTLDSLVATLTELNSTGIVLVELGTAFFVRGREAAGAGDPAPLQHLPSGVQRAILAAETDYYGAADGQGADAATGWTLAVVPFLGRLQDPQADGIAARPPAPRLKEDPVMALARDRDAVPDSAHLDPLLLNFTSRADKQDRAGQLGAFDAADRQRWPRLDPSSVAEEWFRVQSPPRESVTASASDGAASVLATLPADGPGRLSRAAALIRLFDPTRSAIPPAPSSANGRGLRIEPENRDGGILLADTWDRNALPVDKPERYGFHAAGVRLISAVRLTDSSTGAITRLPAVNVLPAPMARGLSSDLLQPVGFAVSPYLGIGFTPYLAEAPSLAVIGGVFAAAESMNRVAVYADLLVVDRAGGRVVPIATSVWQRRPDPDRPGESLAPDNADVLFWAADTWNRLAADSAIGVLRAREIFPDHATGARVRFSFTLLDRTELTAIEEGTPTTRLSVPGEKPRFHPLPIRAELGQLRFPEPGCHRARLPVVRFDAEIAPPRVRSVTPLYQIDPPIPNHPWPGGYSALRLDLELTGQARGVSGTPWPAELSQADDDPRAWWLACPHQVQYASPESDRFRTLPRNFRSRAIRGLSPTLPDVPVPPAAALTRATGSVKDSPLGEAVTFWQPVLPGVVQWAAVGSRAGAFFVFRPHILTQRLADPTPMAFASGSVPVQHRFPRPVPLPPNTQGGQSAALAPWGEWFDLDAADGASRSVAVGPVPADDAFLMTSAGPAGLRVELCGPRSCDRSPFDHDRGALSLKKWLTPPTGGQPYCIVLRFSRLGVDDKTLWPVEVALVDGTLRVPYKPVGDDPGATGVATYVPDVTGDAAKPFNDWIAALAHGASVSWQVLVRPPDGLFQVTGFRQTLTLTTRFYADDVLPLPIRPTYVRFEDPDYSRRLSSPSARKSLPAIREIPGGQQATVISVATDRQQYNPASPLYLVFTVDGVQPSAISAVAGVAAVSALLFATTADVYLTAVRDGVVLQVAEPITAVPPGQLLLIQLPGMLNTLRAGDLLRIGLRCESLKLKETDPVLTLEVVAEPVTPSPDAAFALLRYENPPSSVEGGVVDAGTDAIAPVVGCTRFAWSPSAARIELVNPDDLLRPVVRRRAVYRWLDTVRPRRRTAYAVQKITAGGSTYLPSHFVVLE